MKKKTKKDFEKVINKASKDEREEIGRAAERVTTCKVVVKGVKKYQKKTKKLKRHAKKLRKEIKKSNNTLDKLNRSMKESIELREKLF